MQKRFYSLLLLPGFFLIMAGCSLVSAPFKGAKGAVTGGVWVVKTTYEVTAGTTRVIYRIGEFTYEVVKAPIGWALTHEEIESIDGLPAKEAIRQGRVKASPYVVRGKTYVPMPAEAAQRYREEGIASWYGYESGRMTATGEAFNPNGLTAAHKYLPIPMFVQVTNMENSKSIIVRVNDRGPFPSDQNPKSGDRIIDLSMGAAKRLGFYAKGTTMVRVEAIQVKEE
ncbi:MAG: septal ring lytic transglycosylase RlpA family protein [Candidatus Methylomirabilales bacterium]